MTCVLQYFWEESEDTMIQEKIKTQLEQIKGQGEKLQGQLNKQLDKAKEEGIRILREMGAEVKEDNVNLREVVADLRAANPTLRQFIQKLDVATYDNRFRASWNANMGAAYAKLQAEKTYIKELRPRLEEVRTKVEAQVSQLQTKAKELRERIAS